jgi:pimeloyl-ACP methyl ester carboxylesterase
LIYGLLTLGFLGVSQAIAQDGKPAYQECFADGVSRAVQCYDFEVPLNWDDPEGQMINLHVMVIPAQGATPNPDPVFVLAGGPGQAATDYSPFVSTVFDRVIQTRDIILMDQRGTGDSNALECDFELATVGAFTEDELAEMISVCVESFDADMRYFTSFDIIKDLDFVRGSLGYEKINIWGGSYGTRLGLLFMREHPESIRSAVLDGVVAPQSRLFLEAPGAAEAAWQALLQACAADVRCDEAYPTLDQDLRGLLGDLAENPQTVTVLDIWSGKQVDILVNRDWLAETVRTALYIPTRTSILPLAIQKAKAGDYQSLLALNQDGNFWAGQTMAIGSTLAILCSEEIPRHDAAAVRARGQGTFHEDTYYRFWNAACQSVPTRNVIDGYEAPIKSSIPTMIFSGGLDPVTPPAMGAVAEAHLENVWHFVSPNAGHNVSPVSCGQKIIAWFYNSAAADFDASCIGDPVRPPFLITPLEYGLTIDSKGTK